MATTTLAELARELEAAAATAPARCAAVVAKTALNVKNRARVNAVASSGVHASQYPDKIGYDIESGGLAAVIGPKREGQGNLGPILENGSINNQPHRDLARALDSEERSFVEAAAAIASPWRP